MKTYGVDAKKRKQALKQIVKETIKSKTGFPKFCYGLTIFLRILAVVLGLANILYVILLSNDAIDLIFLIVTLGFPYGFSLISATVYIVSCSAEYRMRRRETVTLANDGFVYSYHDDRTGLTDTVFGIRVVYEKIERFEYNPKTRCLTLYGGIVVDTYENGRLKDSDEYRQVSFLDVFEIDVKKLLEKNC